MKKRSLLLDTTGSIVGGEDGAGKQVADCVTNPPGGDNASGKILYRHTEGERFMSARPGHKDFD